MRTKLCTAMMVVLATVADANASTKPENPLVSDTPVVESVFHGNSVKNDKVFNNGTSSASSGENNSLTPEQRQTIAYTNQQTSSSSSVFGRKFNQDGKVQSSSAGSSSQSSNELQTVSPVNASTMSSGEQRIRQLEEELARKQQALTETQLKLKRTEETYGALPTDENGNPLPESVKNSIPSVPASVMSDNVPKYSGGDKPAGGNGSGITVVPGVNQIVTISIDQPNRIVTPFRNPQILSSQLEGGSNGECGEICVKGNVVYISTKKEFPIGLFITDKDNESTAISLTLVPRRIPPREVSLQLADGSSMTALSGGQEANVWETSQPFVNTVKATLKEIALGEIPSGYHLQKIPSGYNLPVCSQSGLQIDFKKGQLVAGVNLNYVIGKITNVSKKTIEFKEASCGGYDVAAVAAFPYNLLRPGESTEVYVVQRTNVPQKSNQSRRRSLLGR